MEGFHVPLRVAWRMVAFVDAIVPVCMFGVRLRVFNVRGRVCSSLYCGSGTPFECRGVAECRNHVGQRSHASPAEAIHFARAASRSAFHLSNSMRIGWVVGSQSA